MKRVGLIVVAILLVAAMLLSGCAKSGSHGGKKIPAYGLFNRDEAVRGVKYKLSKTNVLCAIILCETVVVPVYIVGWDLFEPVEGASEEVAAPVPVQQPQTAAPTAPVTPQEQTEDYTPTVPASQN